MWRVLNSTCTVPGSNDLARTVGNSDAVLDASGGDSFTDLYGSGRFKNIIAPKQLALRLGRPLILLPQTYGPFRSRRNARIARTLVSRATLAFARDGDSFDRMQALLGSDFDPRRHRLGVDMAFGLRASKPEVVESGVHRALHERGERPLIILNISGLLANEPGKAKQRFSLLADYLALTAGLVTELLQKTNAHILLMPHVQAPNGHYESDLDACQALLDTLSLRLREAAQQRVTTVTQAYDATELKWLVGHADWLCGTRMHSTIAALSMGVPACALAYSLKTRGVFEACGVGEAVVDLRKHSADEARDRVLRTWQDRTSLVQTLSTMLPAVVNRSREQLDEMVGVLQLQLAA
jgi:polysaccharide pyruvyl transferase WcaK-like protein